MTDPSASPRVVIGMPVYNEGSHLSEALDSLLAQTFSDFALLIAENRSTDETNKIAGRYAASDERVTLETGAHHVGAVDNFRRAFFRVRALHPRAQYFAWAGGHDAWDRRWLEVLVTELDSHPELIGVWPRSLVVSRDGTLSEQHSSATWGVTSPAERLRTFIPGDATYGLFRPQYLERAGVYRHVLGPDKLLFRELALYGQLKQVDQVLRQWRAMASSTHGQLVDRQRSMLFTGRIPLYAYVPGRLQQAVAFTVHVGVRGGGPPRLALGERWAMTLIHAVSLFPHYKRFAKARRHAQGFRKGSRRRIKRARRSLYKKARRTRQKVAAVLTGRAPG